MEHLDPVESISTWAEVRKRLEHVIKEAQTFHVHCHDRLPIRKCRIFEVIILSTQLT